MMYITYWSDKLHKLDLLHNEEFSEVLALIVGAYEAGREDGMREVAE